MSCLIRRYIFQMEHLFFKASYLLLHVLHVDTVPEEAVKYVEQQALRLT